MSSAAVPNSIAAICLAMRDEFGLIPPGRTRPDATTPELQLCRFISSHPVMSAIAGTFASDFRNGKHWSSA